MTPQKKIRIGAGFVAIWVLLGGARLCDYFFGDTEFWKLAIGELTVVLGIGAGAAMIREGRRGQEAVTAAGKDANPGNPAGGTAGKDAGIAGPAEETQAGGTQSREHGRPKTRGLQARQERHRPKRPGRRNTGRRNTGRRDTGPQEHRPAGSQAGKHGSQKHGSTHGAAAGREKTINTGQPGSVFRLVIVEAPKAPKT